MSRVRELAGLGLAVVLPFAVTGVVYGHANFVRAEPPAETTLDRAPHQIRLWFTEPLEAGFSEIQVLDVNRRKVDGGDSRVVRQDPTSMVVSAPLLPRIGEAPAQCRTIATCGFIRLSFR